MPRTADARANSDGEGEGGQSYRKGGKGRKEIVTDKVGSGKEGGRQMLVAGRANPNMPMLISQARYALIREIRKICGWIHRR